VVGQDPLVAITFRTTADAGTVVAHADAALTSLGWAPAPDLRDTVWSKVAGSAAGGGSARLSRSGAGGADQSWTLTASAAVPGPHRTASC
jgi:hypothetical protein